MAIDTYFAFIGAYSDVDDALADYDAVKSLHTEAGLIDAYDAAVVEHKDDGKVKIVKKHETPTRVGGVLGGGVGLATGLVIALFPAAAIGTGLLVGTAAGGAVLGAVAGHAAAGMSRKDLKEAGEGLDEGTGWTRRRRHLRHGVQDRTCHEEGAEDRSQATEGRREGDREGRQGELNRQFSSNCSAHSKPVTDMPSVMRPARSSSRTMSTGTHSMRSASLASVGGPTSSASGA